MNTSGPGPRTEEHRPGSGVASVFCICQPPTVENTMRSTCGASYAPLHQDFKFSGCPFKAPCSALMAAPFENNPCRIHHDFHLPKPGSLSSRFSTTSGSGQLSSSALLTVSTSLCCATAASANILFYRRTRPMDLSSLCSWWSLCVNREAVRIVTPCGKTNV